MGNIRRLAIGHNKPILCNSETTKIFTSPDEARALNTHLYPYTPVECKNAKVQWYVSFDINLQLLMK